MTLQDWAAIATIFEAFGTVAVGASALVVSFVALRTQREALPVSLKFHVLTCEPIFDGQCNRVVVELRNTGVRAYVHEVYLDECSPKDLLEEAPVNFVRMDKDDMLPGDPEPVGWGQWPNIGCGPGLRFPRYVYPGQSLKMKLHVSSELRKMKLTAAVSVRRWDSVRLVSSDSLRV